MKKCQSPHHLFLVFFSHLYILTVFLTTFVSCRCPDHQKFALLNIFSNDSALPSWTADASSDCCQWEGITCDHVSGHVIGLDVTNRSIFASFNSSALSSLRSLRFLNLSYNDFNASIIPSNLDSLSHLTHLNLSHSNFTGQIPGAIAHMTNLIVLDLSFGYSENVKLEDPNADVLLRNLSRLTKLHLDGVNISSQVPRFLSNFTRLTSLILSDCNLVGEFPATIFRLPHLKTLDVSTNPQLNGSFPDFSTRSALRILKLSYTGFSGSLPDSFSNLSRLSQLQLKRCKFSGQIPPSLFSLTRLVVLDLCYNNFSGQIPPLDSSKSTGDHGGLQYLQTLCLGWNSLYGTVPLHLFTLPSLKTLCLHSNQLEGELPEFTNASSTLEVIHVSYNKLHGQIPISIFGLRRLQTLSLSHNMLNGSINFAMLPPMHSLSYLHLSHNKLVVNANYVDTSPFPRLRELELASCHLKQFPHFLRHQLELEVLDLSENEIAGEIPSWIWTLGGGNFFSLNLSTNSLTSFQPPRNLLSNSSIKILDLHSNQLQGELPLPPGFIKLYRVSNNKFSFTISSELASRLVEAESFLISRNNISGEIPPSICNAMSLQILDLPGNRLSGSIPNCFGNLTKLNVLNLNDNRLTGIIPNMSGNGCSLRTFNLNGNQLEGNLPEALSNCRDLEVLDVGNNGLSGPFPSYLDIFSNLRVLILRSNNFNGSLSKLCKVSAPMLQIIDLASNSFSGTLPGDCFSGLNALMSAEADEASGDLPLQFIQYRCVGGYYGDTVMVTTKGLELELLKIIDIFKSLDLSNNTLEGEIPKQIGALKLLRVLNMSHNYLKGQIPASIGNARQLESIDLSSNQLFGRIPSEMNSLTFLAVLNLSYNRLVGSIPTGPQFSTFNNNSFIGNPELCGQPLSRKCENSSQGVGGSFSGSSPVKWLLISVQLGYTVGLGIVFGPLLFCRKWRMWYFKKVDMILDYLKELWYHF